MSRISRKLLSAVCLTSLISVALPPIYAHAQTSPANRALDLAPDSPFHDPNMIYLEADELINNDDEQTLTAKGEVEGRYQDRTIRADEVVYYLEKGQVIASGNVVLINADGSTQFADQLELSNELETGAAYNFTSRLPNGGITGAAYASRRGDEGIDLYNAYYTACVPCAESDSNPTWQIKAKRVSQDTDRNLIQYQDAVFELFGIPILYTPYLAHPDNTQDRSSGWLTPFGGYSSSKGVFAELPYYVKLDDHSELTLTPHIYSGVNPLLQAEYRRLFHTGEVNINTSVTYGSQFDRNGDPFLDSYTYLPAGTLAPVGKRVRSHFFADGAFELSEDWDWGFTAQLTSDDLYLRRYDISEPARKGLYDGDTRRLISQIFALGQSDNFRFSASAYGFQSLRTNILSDTAPDTFRISDTDDDGALPIVAPKLEASYFFEDPILDGRFEVFGDFSMLTREIGTDYRRGTAGLSYKKNLILPGGIEAKPFAEVRYDDIEITPYDTVNDVDLNDISFNRTLGQVGMELRWPFMKSSGSVDIIVEPRAMFTQNFGDGENERFRADIDGDNVLDYNYLQDSIDVDFDHNLIWSPNKSTGYDLWQKGFRADVGGSVTALWKDNRASLFLGRSFTDNIENVFEVESGLSSEELVIDPVTLLPITDPGTGNLLTQTIDKSDIVGQLEFNLSDTFTFDTRIRYDDGDNKFRRLDTGFRYNSDRLKTSLRYYKVDQANLLSLSETPAEEINGSVSFNITKNFRASYSASRDLDQDVTRRQSIGIGYLDDCTLIELIYNKYNLANDAVRDSESIGIRISLLSLGDFGVSDEADRF